MQAGTNLRTNLRPNLVSNIGMKRAEETVPPIQLTEPVFGAVLEALETRRLLAATVSGGTLAVTGTSAADDIFIRRDSSGRYVVELNNSVSRFSAASVARISVSGGAGDDLIDVSTSITLPATVNGGDGWDT